MPRGNLARGPGNRHPDNTAVAGDAGELINKRNKKRKYLKLPWTARFSVALNIEGCFR